MSELPKYDTWESLKAQKAYCRKNNIPMVSPNNGMCWRCRRNIYMPNAGFTVEQAKTMLISYCPFCHHSF